MGERDQRVRMGSRRGGGDRDQGTGMEGSRMRGQERDGKQEKERGMGTGISGDQGETWGGGNGDLGRGGEQDEESRG